MDSDKYSAGIIDKMLSCASTEEAKFYAMSIARLLSKESLKIDSAFAYFKILNLNFKEASDLLFTRRSPETFFSTIEPCGEIIVSALEILVKYRAKELYEKNILACFGILDNAYKNAGFGLSLYALSVSDLQHAAKYLILNDEKINHMLLNFLEYIRLVSDYKYKLIVITAKEISDSYYDNKKDISKVIPHNLLV